MQKKLVKISKFLSFVLRHNPSKVGLSLEPDGWVHVEKLLIAARKAGVQLDKTVLRQVVEQNDKQRFSFSEDGLKIRANQGHSLPVALGLKPLVPPERLFHGTATRFLASIQRHGLLPKGRNHVHLSPDEHTAINVGQRHGKPVVLKIQAGEMYQQGFHFYLSANGVWLTENVSPEFIIFPS